MKEIFDLLNDTEKKILGFLCLFLGVVLLFFLVISLPQRGSYFRALSSLSAKQKEYYIMKINPCSLCYSQF